MLSSNMVISVTEGVGDNRKRKEIGKVKIFTPDLTEIMKVIVDAKETSKDEDGLPVYDTQEANWTFNAIHNAVKMAARNKLENKTVNLKDGLKIAETMAELTEEGQRDGNGQGLAILREAKADFAKWVQTLGKSEAATTFIITMFSNRQALATQPSTTKEKVAKYVEDFALSLSDETLEKYARPLQMVTESCAAPSLEAATDF